MTENNKNRFIDNETDCLIDSSFTDNLTKKIYVIDEWERIIGLCNNLWEQTQRFEKENQRLNTEIEQLYELINFANTLIAFKSSESCQKEWEKRLKEVSE